MGNLSLFTFRTYSSPAVSPGVGFNDYADFNYEWYWRSYGITDLISYYANLLIIQYRSQPKAFATMAAMVAPVIMDQLPNQVQNAFNLLGPDYPEGIQLDILAKYVGVTRSGYGFYGSVTLNDADFLTLIQMGIIRNRSGSSLATIQLLLNQFFAGEVFVFDYANMYMSYLINTSVGSQDLVDLFVTEGLLPKPMGVGLSVIAHPIINKFFGLRTYLAPASPFVTPLNSYTSYQTSWLFLSYSYAVGP